jgi:hypothetical protein
MRQPVTSVDEQDLCRDPAHAVQLVELVRPPDPSGRGAILVWEPAAVTAERTSVVAAVADTELLRASRTRIAATIFNESTAVLYVGLGWVPVSPIDYSVQVPAGGSYQVPREFVGCAIRGYWAAANGAARVTVG